MRGQLAHPWTADYDKRTVTVHENVRAATSLTGDGRRGLPLAWADADLLLLSAASRSAGGPDVPGDVAIFEAQGPGYVAFETAVRQLATLVAASVIRMEPQTGAARPLTGPLVIRHLARSPDGRRLFIEHTTAEDDPDDRLDWTGLVIDVSGGGTSPAAAGARWVTGRPGLLSWRENVRGGTRVHLGGPSVAVSLLIRHPPSDGPLAWWAVWHRGAPLVISHHRAGLRLTGTDHERVMPLPAELARFGEIASVPVAGQGPDRLVLGCVDVEGRPGIAVVDLAEPAVTVLWAPRGPDAGFGEPWPADLGDAVELLVGDHDGVRRYEVEGADLRPRSPLPGIGPMTRRGHDQRPLRLFAVRAGGHPSTLTFRGVEMPGHANGPAPALLWIRAADADSRRSAQDGERYDDLMGGAYPVGILDLPLRWPGDVALESLHDQITTVVTDALDVLQKRCGIGPVVVGGHSFGATLALYALAHLPGLSAGIAHSGCYNRTLTPTGFQYERRPYWAVPDVYEAFSALLFADRIKHPVLIVHGAEDTNPATTPDQAVDLYRGIVATGGHARLVLLPGEGHSFRYRESRRALLREHREWLRRWDSDAT
jgi:dienelactone hydrolase